ncbi:hypothetical protein GEMRC1_003412 [Eukaryota sp. GEM-RC1]
MIVHPDCVYCLPECSHIATVSSHSSDVIFLYNSSTINVTSLSTMTTLTSWTLPKTSHTIYSILVCQDLSKICVITDHSLVIILAYCTSFTPHRLTPVWSHQAGLCNSVPFTIQPKAVTRMADGMSGFSVLSRSNFHHVIDLYSWDRHLRRISVDQDRVGDVTTEDLISSYIQHSFGRKRKIKKEFKISSGEGQSQCVQMTSKNYSNIKIELIPPVRFNFRKIKLFSDTNFFDLEYLPSVQSDYSADVSNSKDDVIDDVDGVSIENCHRLNSPTIESNETAVDVVVFSNILLIHSENSFSLVQSSIDDNFLNIDPKLKILPWKKFSGTASFSKIFGVCTDLKFLVCQTADSKVVLLSMDLHTVVDSISFDGSIQLFPFCSQSFLIGHEDHLFLLNIVNSKLIIQNCFTMSNPQFPDFKFSNFENCSYLCGKLLFYNNPKDIFVFNLYSPMNQFLLPYHNVLSFSPFHLDNNQSLFMNPSVSSNIGKLIILTSFGNFLIVSKVFLFVIISHF